MNAVFKRPVYEPLGARPLPEQVADDREAAALIEEIDASPLPEPEKRMLRAAAWRFARIRFDLAAELYAHAAPELRRLMERTLMIIVDHEQAIERGWLRLSRELMEQCKREASAGS